MNISSDILQLIVSKMDNNSIRSLSLVPDIWQEVISFTRTSHFWFLRIQHLVGREMSLRDSIELSCLSRIHLSWKEGDWKEAYYILSHSRRIDNDQDNSLAASILLELGVDPTDDRIGPGDIEPIISASSNGHVNIVRLLLTDQRVDPSIQDNFSIREASEHGHTEVVRLLLSDPRVDPSVMNNFCIREASDNRHTEVIRLLLQDSRVDPSAEENEAIRYASTSGNLEVVKILLQDSRVDPSDGYNYAVQDASEYGHTEVVKLLLQDERVDPTSMSNYAIESASRQGYTEIVRLIEEWMKIHGLEYENSSVIGYSSREAPLF